jgi:hypothetical protein
MTVLGKMTNEHPSMGLTGISFHGRLDTGRRLDRNGAAEKFAGESKRGVVK